MWIEERDGKFRFFERYNCPFSGKTKRVSVTLNSKSRQAVKEAQSILARKIESKLGEDPSQTTLNQAVEDFYTHKSTFVKASTLKGARGAISVILEVLPKDILLKNINSKMLQSAVNQIASQNNYANSYFKKVYGELRQVLKYAYRMDVIKDISFLDKVVIPTVEKTRDAVEKEKAKYLDSIELKEVLAMVKEVNEPVSLILEFQSLTGLRYGELAALRIQDYDKNNNVIDVNGTLSWLGKVNDPKTRTTPKNIHSYRKVELCKRATWIISHFITASKIRRAWQYGASKNDYIFTNTKGNPYNLQQVNKILKSIHYKKPISSHTFRHTHISMLATANVPLKAIMDRVGHNEPRTTLAVYTHVTENMKKTVIKALENNAI